MEVHTATSVKHDPSAAVRSGGAENRYEEHHLVLQLLSSPGMEQ